MGNPIVKTVIKRFYSIFGSKQRRRNHDPRSLKYVASGRVTAVILICGGTTTMSNARAQAPIPLPQMFTMSPGGVDLSSGVFYDTHADIGINKLTLERTWRAFIPAEADNVNGPADGFLHSLRIKATQQRVQDIPGQPLGQYSFRVFIHIGNTAYSFRRGKDNTDPFYEEGFLQGRELTWTGGAPTRTYYFTNRDDTRYEFLPMTGNFSTASYVSSVVRADGYRLDFAYDATGSKLRMVRDNMGAALVFEDDGSRITKVCAVNLAAVALTPGATCPAGVPTATYSYSTSVFAYTSPSGGTYSFTPESSSSPTRTITIPGASTPIQTLTIGLSLITGRDRVTRQDFADGSWYTYPELSGDYGFAGPVGTTHVKFDGVDVFDGGTDSSTFQVGTGPYLVEDPLGRQNVTSYCGAAPPCASTAPNPVWRRDPELNQINFTYDNIQNPLSATTQPKPGSSLANSVVSATYATSFGAKSKPLTVTDTRNNTTSYTYDPTHGGVLTETLPADANGLQAVKRYAYGQYYAWLSNGTGGYVAAATPVWLLSQERTCRTSATTAGATGATMGCAGGAADEVVVGYDYGLGDAAHGNNLLLRGKVVTAQDGDGVIKSQRTCFGYDATGNKIWETGARAGLTSCQ